MAESIHMGVGPFYMSRTLPKDGAGDSGGMLCSIGKDENGEYTFSENGLIEVGKRIRCGTFGSRTYRNQDYWTTSIVTEITQVDIDNKWIEFKTGNSTYRLAVL